MSYRPLIAYLVLVALLSAAIITAMKFIGEKGIYFLGFYMLVPAVAAIVVRLMFYEQGFRDAHLRVGRLVDYLKFWGVTVGIVALSYLAYTVLSAVSWDFSGESFLKQFEKQMAAGGTDIYHLPRGMTPKDMLLLFFVGGLTVFNIPMVIAGFGEEFGWRGFMFPILYRVRPWVGFVVGGLIWFAWHVPLVFVVPSQDNMSAWQQAGNAGVLAMGSIFSFTFFAYVYAKTGTIWVASFAHAVFNNASRSFSYFTQLEDQLAANIGLSAAMAIVVAVLWIRGEFRVFQTFFASPESAEPAAALDRAGME